MTKIHNAEELLMCENELLDRWANNCPGLIRDGVVNPEQYLNSKIKILYLLKEVNGGSDWDLRDFLRAGGRKQTWNNIARWAKGIFSLPKEIPWAELENITDDEREKILQMICAVNVKKTSGSHTADEKLVKEAAGRDAEYLRNQIDLYMPDIIICCGTEWDYWHEIMKSNPDWKQSSRGIWYFIENTGRIVVSYSHPEARTKSCLLYYGLMDCVQEIFANEHFFEYPHI
jgi:hypothetical protein